MTSRPDDDPWADASGMLEDPRGEEPPSLVRNRRRAILLGVLGILVAAAVGAAIGTALGAGADGPSDVPIAQQALGYLVAAVGLAVQAWSIRQQWKATRGRRGWSSPLMALTRVQRTQLTDQVRGRRAVEAGTEELSVLRARAMAQQRPVLWSNAGLALLWIGLWLASPTWWRLVLVVVLVGLAVVGALVLGRDVRAGDRFLAERADR